MDYRMFAASRKVLRDSKANNMFVAQRGAQEMGLSSSADITVFGGSRGGGKANTITTPVVTPSGFRLMGDIVVGDKICTPYEGVQTVEAIFDQGEAITYIFSFDDGTKIQVMDNHRFWARLTPGQPFKEYAAREIIDRYRLNISFPQSLRRTVSDCVEIPLCGQVEMNENIREADLPLHPFILGYISGSGYWHFREGGIKLNNLPWLEKRFRRYGYKIILNQNDGFYYLRGITDANRRRITKSRQREPAHIPLEYKTACVSARWQYLKGVMYLNGRSKRKTPFIALPNKRLIEDIADMARSLGCWVYMSQVDDIPEKMGWWSLMIKAPNCKELFIRYNYKLQGKIHAPYPTSPHDPLTLTKKIIKIEKYKKKVPCRCITVSGSDHLYLTDAFTVNHNTITMLMEPLYDFHNKQFNGIIFRKNKDDFENIINESSHWYRGLGRYNRSKDDMTWYFKTGAKLGFSHYDMTLKDFDDKYRGQQFAYIGIDELPQMPFDMFKFLLTFNRNTAGIHSRLLGTCNPDPHSWLRRFIDWWVAKEDTVYEDGQMHPERKGFIIPERDGKIRYFYMPDNSVDSIFWGDTPEEVYMQCRDLIDSVWNPEWEQFGYSKMSFAVKSVTFIKASLNDNHELLKRDKNYIANLLNQPYEVRARELEGNWDIIETGSDLIQPTHLQDIFRNAQMTGDGVRRATCDVAGTGGDNCVTWFWIGWHVADVFVCRRDPLTTVGVLSAKLREWGVLEQNLAYDLNGMGQVLKGAFPSAVPFNNQEAVEAQDKYLYDNKKSQCAYRFAERTRQKEWSIEPLLLQRQYRVGRESHTLYNILQKERKCVRQDMSKADKGWCLIPKEQMKLKAHVGHSPDFFEALFMREIFDIKEAAQVEMPTWIKMGRNTKIRTLGATRPLIRV